MGPRTRSTARNDVLEVWLDAYPLGRALRVGWLAHDRGHIRFRYDLDWLKHPACFAIDPELWLDEGVAFPDSRRGSFGIFLDSAPDRWGQTLMDRREVMLARDEGRPVRTLRAWDYLLGVQDETRQGALRFRREDSEVFLDRQPRAAPPVTTLGELQAVSLELTRGGHDTPDQVREWLAVLVAPGSSLGGARPKANFRQPDGSLWIAKFPAHGDSRDVAAWECLAHRLASRAGVSMAESEMVGLGGSLHHTFCTRRFDRVTEGRVFYSSAMTLLRKGPDDQASYLDLAQVLSTHGDPAHRAGDLEQLFRRVVFNVAVGNRDDHLRNHGFLLTPSGWRLAPAFDVNPAPDRDMHVLAIDDRDPRPVLANALDTAELYGLSRAQADGIVLSVLAAVQGWRDAARALGISRDEIAATEPAFSAGS